MAKNKVKKILFFLNGKMDYTLLIITVLLLCMGLIMLLSASAPTSLSESGNSYKYVIKQGIMALLGLIAMIVLSKIDYRIYRKFKKVIYLFFLALLILVGIIGTDAGGARRWINIFGFSFQPSEFAKVGFIIFYSALLSDMKEKNKIKKLVPGFIYPILFLFPIIFAIYKLQNHFSATFIICAITFIQMFVAGSSFKYFLGGGALRSYWFIRLCIKKIY